MKTTLTILTLFLMACGETSSPEGRMKLKNDALQTEINELKSQQEILIQRVAHLEKKIDSLGRAL